MPAKLCAALVALIVLISPLVAQPAPKPLDDRTLVTQVYSVKHLLGKRGKTSGVTDADAIIKLFFEAIPQLRELKTGTDGPQIIERDGGKLEVRTTAKVHSEVKDLLDALDRLADVAIDVKADVYELDTASYEKLAKALPKGKAKLPVLFAVGRGIRGEGTERSRMEGAEGGE